MKLYKKPVVSIISVKINGVLSGSKVYNCPLKPRVACHDYNKRMQEWKKAVEYAAANKLNHRFLIPSDEMSCPHKDCNIFVQWQKQQQKTR